MFVRGRASFWLSSPLLLAQGRRVRRRALRFPAASGPSEGTFGSGEPSLRLLGLGDSIIAGVGAPTVAESMVGVAARHIAERSGGAVHWQARGEIGARAARVYQLASDVADEVAPDVVILSVGVNDVTAAARSSRWKRDLRALLVLLRTKYPQATLVLAGLPPLGGFPLLPDPLRTLLGWRARWFDRVAREELRALPHAVHVPIDFETTRSAFSADGFHPSASSHLEFGRALAEATPLRR